ncbi:putative P-loop containing nucleoside triphosphate hydrolase, leucine-rich repeat domain, L [Medicago truncatula]|uniref:Putative P-loop containing nucleoside triphosphate hydrolase, leucine-rich repeat domain, L n=1 Tax=Medicago truncatula TaxID=3880 RepID=A0A396ITK3_MEDTR|nr:putative P-loop containing nucleoside triphosphate hydrolase, leucine-rich repeat domain, L [Medicago truncatula]
MCETALSLLPLARDHLLPLFKEAFNMIRGNPKEIVELKDELESIEDFINDADRRADDVEDKKIKDMIKQLIEASYHIEDVVDDYILLEEQQSSDPGCAAGAVDLVKTKILRLQITYKIQNIKSRIREIKETSAKDHGFNIQSSSDKPSSSSATNRNASFLQNLRDAPFYMDEADLVGFEEPRDKLIDLLVEGRAERTVVSIVGMGGLGKTTIAKKVFDNQKVVKHFDCHVWITVSRPYNIEKLLREILLDIYKQQGEDPPQSLHQMDRKPLVDEVRNYLQGKRNKVVADACKKSFGKVHELERLSEEQSLELFKKKAFHDLDGVCPENLFDISSKIVENCKGLPLAIVVTGDILSRKNRNPIEWSKFSENINVELEGYSTIRKILGFSYHNLPYNLKSCFLYFGLYPEDYIVHSKTLTRQWIAEGFVKEDRGRTLEEVAEGYLIELIHRSLVQVVSISIDGRVKSCRVHDLVHAMILDKYEDLSFCKNITEDKQLSLTGMIRRLSIETTSDNLMKVIENSHVRSLLIFTPKTSLKSFVRTIPTKYRRLKVLALMHKELAEIPNDLGSLNHLKYLEFGMIGGRYSGLPKSIGMIANLETLDLRYSNYEIRDMPKEICKLRKLRHLLGDCMSLIQLKDGIGGMTSLQTLSEVYLDENEDENDNRVVELIQELGKLNKIRKLSLIGVRSKYMSAISSSINQMQQMEKLLIGGISFIGLDLNSPPPRLQRVKLDWHLRKLPEWISKLKNLVELKVTVRKEGNDAMKLLQSMPNLLLLCFTGDGRHYEDKFESIHFQDGWFKNLKELYLTNFYSLSHILIDEGALGSLKKLNLSFNPQLMTLPTGIHHLHNLEVLYMKGMSVELMQSIAPDDGKEHPIFMQVPFVDISCEKYLIKAIESFTSVSLRKRNKKR